MRIAAQCVHGVGLCILPKVENDFRPLALRHGPLAWLATLLVVAKVLTIGIVGLTPAQAELSTITSARIVQLANTERQKAGLPVLAINSALTTAAAEKARHMLEEDYFAHISPSGVTPWFWIKKTGYAYQVAGENLAIDFSEAEDVVAAWMASPTHRANIVHPDYVETGVAVLSGEFQGGTSIVVVHMFGLPLNAPARAPAATPAVESETTQQPTPAPPQPSPNSPPPAPRIAFAQPTQLVRDEVQLNIEGKAGTEVSILANLKTIARLTLPASGVLSPSLRLAAVPDGSISLQAFSTSDGGAQSELSTPVSAEKDTQEPNVQRDDVSFVLAPITDQPLVLLQVADREPATIQIASGTDGPRVYTPGELLAVPDDGKLLVAAVDAAGNQQVLGSFALLPQFAEEARAERAVQPPARFSQLTRRIGAAIFSVVAVLLLLAIFIEIRMQRPRMIGHALLVLVLAATLFFS